MATTGNTPTEDPSIAPKALPEKPTVIADGTEVFWNYDLNNGKGDWDYRIVTTQGNNGGDGPGRPKAPPDPYAPIMRSFFSAYFKIWGTLPPPGYVEGAARSMNLYEFIEQERKKPAFRQTETYRNEAARLAAVRDQLLGYY